MAAAKEFTFKDVESHSSKKDLYLIIHDKIYDTTNFVDEHPGGEEVLLDVGGKDATEAFEDVGHSDEAREILEGLLLGDLKRVPGDPEPKAAPPPPSTTTATKDSAGMGVGLYAILLVGGVLAFLAYQYLQTQGK